MEAGGNPFDVSVDVEVRGLSLYTHHGVSEAEQEVGQRLEFDITFDVPDCDAVLTDRLEDTVDYGPLTVAVARIVEDESYRLVERLADRIAGLCLSLSGVRSVEVSVRKLRPPVPVLVASVGVTLHRRAAPAGEPSGIPMPPIPTRP